MNMIEPIEQFILAILLYVGLVGGPKDIFNIGFGLITGLMVVKIVHMYYQTKARHDIDPTNLIIIPMVIGIIMVINGCFIMVASSFPVGAFVTLMSLHVIYYTLKSL